MSRSSLPSGVPKRRGHGHPSGQRLSLPGGRDLPSLRLPAGQSHRQREGSADGVLQDEPSPGRVQNPRGQGRRLLRVFASPLSASLFPMDPDGVKGFAGNQARLTEAVHSGGQECKCHRVLRTDGPRRLREPISKRLNNRSGGGERLIQGLRRISCRAHGAGVLHLFVSMCDRRVALCNLTTPPVCSALKVL